MNTYITGSTIKALREKKGLTQSELAARVGVGAKAVSKWETAKGLPDITLLEPLAITLGVSVAELLSGNTVQNKNCAASKPFVADRLVVFDKHIRRELILPAVFHFKSDNGWLFQVQRRCPHAIANAAASCFSWFLCKIVGPHEISAGSYLLKPNVVSVWLPQIPDRRFNAGKVLHDYVMVKTVVPVKSLRHIHVLQRSRARLSSKLS